MNLNCKLNLINTDISAIKDSLYSVVAIGQHTFVGSVSIDHSSISNKYELTPCVTLLNSKYSEIDLSALDVLNFDPNVLKEFLDLKFKYESIIRQLTDEYAVASFNSSYLRDRLFDQKRYDAMLAYFSEMFPDTEIKRVNL